MITFRQSDNGLTVHKNGSNVASIRKATSAESSDWGNVLLIHSSGRIDRHHSFESARDDALKT